MTYTQTMFKTPPRQAASQGAEKPSPKTLTLTYKVRQSIGEWEAARTENNTTTPLTAMTTQAGPARMRLTNTLSQDSTTSLRPSADAKTKSSPKPPPPKYKSRTAEAKACLLKAKLQIDKSKNLRNDIKSEVLEAVDRLYTLVKEAEEARSTGEKLQHEENSLDHTILAVQMKEQTALLHENNKRIDELKVLIERQSERVTYASVVANHDDRVPKRQPVEDTALHSVVITSKDENETGEQVFDHIRKAVNAREEGVRIDRIRRARDRKVIVGCKTQEEIGKVKDRIRKAGGHLNMEEIQNKDPLIVLLGVLKSNSDEDILRALKVQNNHLLRGLTNENDRMEVRFRRRARNPLTAHIVVKVSPFIWGRLTEAGMVHVDLQRVRVADQSPLVQCSRCLGYGHGKRFCREPEMDVCSHCGGPHMKVDCADWLAEVPPSCCNCRRAKLEGAEHNAFSTDCPVRRKWEALARSTVAYC